MKPKIKPPRRAVLVEMPALSPGADPIPRERLAHARSRMAPIGLTSAAAVDRLGGRVVGDGPAIGHPERVVQVPPGAVPSSRRHGSRPRPTDPAGSCPGHLQGPVAAAGVGRDRWSLGRELRALWMEDGSCQCRAKARFFWDMDGKWMELNKKGHGYLCPPATH